MFDAELSPVWERLAELLPRHLRSFENSDGILPSMELVELGLDSMAAINLLLEVEDTFGVVFPDDLLNSATFSTGASLRDAIASLLQVHSNGQ